MHTKKERRRKLTKEILHDSPIHGPRINIAKDQDRCSDLTKTEGLDGGREAILGIKRLTCELARDLAIGQLIRIHDFGRPEGSSGIEDGLVEDVIIAEMRIFARHAAIVFEEAVDVELVAGKELISNPQLQLI